MFEDIKKMAPAENKLVLENILEGDEAIQAARLLLKICKVNGLHSIGYGLSRLQLKIAFEEVVYSEK